MFESAERFQPWLEPAGFLGPERLGAARVHSNGLRTRFVPVVRRVRHQGIFRFVGTPRNAAVVGAFTHTYSTEDVATFGRDRSRV